MASSELSVGVSFAHRVSSSLLDARVWSLSRCRATIDCVSTKAFSRARKRFTNSLYKRKLKEKRICEKYHNLICYCFYKWNKKANLLFLCRLLDQIFVLLIKFSFLRSKMNLESTNHSKMLVQPFEGPSSIPEFFQAALRSESWIGKFPRRILFRFLGIAWL